MRHPKEVGDRSTLAIMVALKEQGYTISVPFGENSRYDLIVDNGGRLSRVQCKTGRLRNGSIEFSVASRYAHHPHPKVRCRSYLGEIDEFAVFCPETRGIYLIPIDDICARAAACLRVDPPRNNQAKNVRFASRYEIARLDVY